MVLLINKSNHPVSITYKENVLILPPWGRTKIDNPNLLGAIPKEVVLVDKEKNNK